MIFSLDLQSPFPSRVLLIGKPGTGKSAKMLDLLLLSPRVVLFDTQGRYSRPDSADTLILKMLRGFDYVGPDDLTGYLRENLTAPAFRVCVSAPFAPAEALEKVCCLVCGAKEIALGVDEARVVARYKLGRWLSRVANWRADRVWLFANSQRPAQLHPDLRGAADHWFVFQTTGALDLRALADEGLPVSEVGVNSLPRFSYLHYRTDGVFSVHRADLVLAR